MKTSPVSNLICLRSKFVVTGCTVMCRSVVCAGFGACHAGNGGVWGDVSFYIGCLVGGVAY